MTMTRPLNVALVTTGFCACVMALGFRMASCAESVEHSRLAAEESRRAAAEAEMFSDIAKRARMIEETP